MKIIFIILVVFFISIMGVSSQNLMDSYDFENHKIVTSNSTAYQMLNEPESDSLINGGNSWFGCRNNATINSRFFIYTPTDNEFNTIKFNDVSSTGSPTQIDLKLNVYMCETTDSQLDSSTGFSQCSGDIITMVENFPASDLWNLITGTKKIFLNNNYQMESGKRYIILIDSTQNFLYNNAYWDVQYDDNPTSIFMKKLYVNSSVQTTSWVADMDLILEITTNEHFYAQSDYQWDCDSLYYPSGVRCNNDFGDCNEESYFSIEQEPYNKFLRMYTNDFSQNGYEDVQLKWDFGQVTNGKYFNSNFSIGYRIRVNNINWAVIYPQTTYKNYVYSGASYSGSLCADCVAQIGKTDTNDLNVFASLKSENKGIGQNNRPINNTCYVNDGDWHSVIQHFIMNDTIEVKTILTYIDGNLCDTHNIYLGNIPTLNNVKPYIMFNSRAIFNIDIDDIVVYDFLAENIDYDSEFDYYSTCPYENCIFYDGFNSYPEGFNLSLVGYSGVTNDINLDVNNSLVYINGNDYLQRDIGEYDYSKIENNIIMFSKAQYTPEQLEEDTYIYSFSDVCENGNTVSEIIVLFDYYENTSSFFTGYETNINFYVKNPDSGQGNLQLNNLGSFVIPNGQYFGFTRVYDSHLRKFFINVYYQDNYEQGILPKTQDNIYSYNAPCDIISHFKIERLGGSNLTNDYAIAEISYLGDYLTSDTDLTWDYTNQTTQDDALIKTEVGEDLHNLAFSLGFKKVSSKIIFWMLLIIALLFGVFKSEIPDNAKLFGSITVTVLSVLMGWYWGFFPDILFIFLILIVAMIGAYFITKIAKGETPEE